MLCQKQFIATTEAKLIQGHFKAVHKAKNVKPKQIKRICRICSWDKSATDAELIKHISESHPPDHFADDDDEEDDKDEDNKHLKEVLSHQPKDREEEEEEAPLIIKPPPPPPPIPLPISVENIKLEDGECCSPAPPRLETIVHQVAHSSLFNNGSSSIGNGTAMTRKRKHNAKTRSSSSSSSSEEEEESSADSSSSSSSLSLIHI